MKNLFRSAPVNNQTHHRFKPWSCFGVSNTLLLLFSVWAVFSQNQATAQFTIIPVDVLHRPLTVTTTGTVAGNSGLGPFIWSKDSGFSYITDGLGSTVTLSDTSADATVLVGARSNAGQSNAVIWTEATGYEDIVPPEFGVNSIARGVSDDGSVVVGSISGFPFVWSRDLGLTAFDPGTVLWDISGDGKRAFGWNQGAELKSFGLDNEEIENYGPVASSVLWSINLPKFAASNRDGSVTAVNSTFDSGPAIDNIRPGLAVDGLGIVQLPKLKQGATLSNDVSGAGDLVVGVGLDSENGGFYNYVWGARFGARTFTALPGSTSEHVGACSRDGSVLAGRGNLPEIGQYYMYVGKPDVCNLILDLIATIRAMGIQKGVTNALIAKLEVAKMAIVADNAEQRSDAPNKIEAFIAHVEAQRGKKLDDDQANKLADSAREILFWLGSR